jgi:polyisoprenoid-binding protein YceI
MKKLLILLTISSLASCNLNNSNKEAKEVSLLTASDGVYNIENETSYVTWTGREVSTSFHYGTIDLASGQFELSEGLISSGEFVVDMTSIKNQDLPSEFAQDRLETHLKSDDFFSVEAYPTAKISISQSAIISEGKWLVSADLTIKNFTHPIEFEMVNSVEGWNASLVFDRSLYEVKFRSGTFFEMLGDKMIYDDIELEINLKTL